MSSNKKTFVDMILNKEIEKENKIKLLCNEVKELISKGDYDSCENRICHAMEEFPHNPEPHNLMGILMEKSGNHPLAMKHFRAALAIEPTYKPVRENLINFGTFRSTEKYIYDEDDCAKEKEILSHIEYDENHIGHIVRRSLK